MTFSDGTFAPADWSVMVFKTKPGSFATVEQRLQGGNPDAFRRVFHRVADGSFASPSEVVSLHQRRDADYDPGRQGPIDQICYGEDAFILDGFGQGQSTGPALWQRGRVYIYFVGPTYMPDKWLRRDSPALTATDFVELLPTTARDRTSHPDFSRGGDPITFGFLRANTSHGMGWPLDGAIDNWVVDVNCPFALPSPTATGRLTATPTETATSTASSTATSSSTPTWTPTATRTQTPIPPPTASPAPPLAPIYLPLLLREDCREQGRFADVVLVLDLSSSMVRATGAGRSKLDAALAAARSFVDHIDFSPDTAGRRNQLALVAFHERAWLAYPLGSDPPAMRAALAVLAGASAAGTRLDLALQGGLDALGPGRQSENQAVLILLTDGLPNGVPTPVPAGSQEDAILAVAAQAKLAGVTLYAIGLGLPDAADPNDRINDRLLSAIASRPDQYYQTPDAEELTGIFTTLARRIPCPGETLWSLR